MGVTCSTYGGIGEVYSGFWWGEHLEDPGVDGRMILRWIFRKWNVGAWTGLIWFRIRKGGEHL